MMTMPEMTGAGMFALTVLGLLVRHGNQNGRIETKLDVSLERLGDHEDRIRAIEHDKSQSQPHLKPHRSGAV